VILVAGVGYSHLSDLSFGPQLVERLQAMEWPAEVQIEDLSYGPITVVQWFQDDPGRFDRAIFAGAMQRGRPPAMVTRYEWDNAQWSPEDVHQRVTEAVTGVVSVENTLVVAGYFGLLPARTSVIEFEPVDVEWGLELGQFGKQRLNEVVDAIRDDVFLEAEHTERRQTFNE
jgi:hydrogenase maturation protease